MQHNYTPRSFKSCLFFELQPQSGNLRDTAAIQDLVRLAGARNCRLKFKIIMVRDGFLTINLWDLFWKFSSLRKNKRSASCLLKSSKTVDKWLPFFLHELHFILFERNQVLTQDFKFLRSRRILIDFSPGIWDMFSDGKIYSWLPQRVVSPYMLLLTEKNDDHFVLEAAVLKMKLMMNWNCFENQTSVMIVRIP